MRTKGKKKDISMADKDTIRLMYEESWRQYVHEDKLSEERNAKYLSLLTMLYGALGIMISIMMPGVLTFSFGSIDYCCQCVILLVIVLVIQMIVMQICRQWKIANEAGRLYVAIRFETILMIEEQYGLEINIAGYEMKKLEELGKTQFQDEGFSTTNGIITTFYTLSNVIMAVAAAGVLVTVGMYCRG